MRRQVAIGFAALHIALFLAFLAYFRDAGHHDAQAMLLWNYWLAIDFPVSLLVPAGWSLIEPDSPLTRYWLYFVHGILGTAWWYSLPLIVARIYRRLR